MFVTLRMDKKHISRLILLTGTYMSALLMILLPLGFTELTQYFKFILPISALAYSFGYHVCYQVW